jgi:dihydroceramide fatty acyl 2-hydroxylase
VRANIAGMPLSGQGLSLVFWYLRAPLIAYGPFAVVAPVLAWGSLSVVGTTVWWLGGFAFWTLFEYAVHRWVQHSPRIRPWVRRWDDHTVHHANPDDPEGFVSMLGETLPIAVVISGLTCAAAPTVAAALAWLAGFCAGYLAYEWIHCAAHLPELHRGRPWLARWSENHLRHHWERANTSYGFMTSTWDRLLGTYPPPG